MKHLRSFVGRVERPLHISVCVAAFFSHEVYGLVSLALAGVLVLQWFDGEGA